MNLFNRKKSLDTNSMENGVSLVTVSMPNSTDAEQFNTIRTNIQFSNIDKQQKSLMITSSMASEGKSTVAANVAVTFAKQGMQTLLVDADFRRPTLNASFAITDPRGLTNYLSDSSFDVNSILYKTTVNNFYVLPSGPIPPNPSELIGSHRMTSLMNAISERFDMVIYDAPPVLSVTDGQLLATKVDGTILVIRQGKTQKEAIKQAVEMIKHVDGNIIGTIMNDVDNSGNGYYGYYGTPKN